MDGERSSSDALAVLAAGTARGPAAAARDRARARARRRPASTRAARRRSSVDLETGQVVYDVNAAARALAPASAEKLAVSFAALRVLGTGYRFRTEVAGVGRARRTRLAGRPLPRRLRRSHARRRRPGSARAPGRGMGHPARHRSDARRRIAFRRDPRPRAAGGRGSSARSPPRSRRSRSTTSRRTARTGRPRRRREPSALRSSRRGVAVRGVAAAGRRPSEVLPLAQDLSEPLAEIVRHMNRESDNFVSEMLLKELGASVAREGSSAAGGEVVRRALADAGVPLARRPDRRRLRALAARPADGGEPRRRSSARLRPIPRSATRSSPRSPSPASREPSNDGSTAARPEGA